MARTIVVNPNQSEEDNITRAINETNLTTHESKFILYAFPYPIDGVVQDDPDIDNTTLTLDSTPDSKYTGGDTFTYHRIHLRKQWEIVKGTNLILEMPKSTPLNHESFFAIMGKYLALRKESIDTVFEVNPTDPNDIIVRAVAKPNSYLYIGEFRVKLKLV